MTHRGVYIADHRIDRGVRIGHQPAAVAVNGAEAGDGMPDAKQVLVALRSGGDEGRIPAGRGIQLSQAGGYLAHPRDALAAYTHLAKQEIGDNTEEGDRQDHHDPGDA